MSLPQTMSRARRHAALVVFLLASIVLSGCVGDDTRDGADTTAGAGQEKTDGARTDDGMDGPEGEDPDVAHAPDWRPGTWWRWQATPRDSDPYEARTAVARIEDGHYVIGWGNIDEGLRSQFFHFIPNGPVDMDDLSWGAHHTDITWLDFPLEDGKTWDGAVWLADLAFTATAMDVPLPDGSTGPGFHVSGVGRDGGVRAEVLWSVDLQVFTRLEFWLFDESAPWFALDLLEHGDGATGIHVLHSDLHQATFTGLHTHAMSGTSPPVADTIEVGPDITHAAVGCYLGGAPGHYAFEMTGPDGETTYGCRMDNTPPEETFALRLDQGIMQRGTWTTSFRTVGEGTVFTELFLLRDEVVDP